MNYIKTKYYPSYKLDYIYFILNNMIFLNILLIHVIFIFNVIKENNYKKETFLIIPKATQEFEEKRDLIFNLLSLNKEILSVNQINEKEVKNKLLPVLKNTEIDDSLIPEVYILLIENSNNIKIKDLNDKVIKIITGAIIFQTAEKNKSMSLIIISALITLFFFILSNFFLNNNLIIKIKKYLILSRYFGAKSNIILINLNLGLLMLLILVFIVTYLTYYFYIRTFFLKINDANFTIIFTSTLSLYISIIIINFSLQLKHFLKKIY